VIALGVVLVVVGAVILWALNLDLEFVTDDALGIILIVAGLAAIVLGLVMNAQRNRRKTTVEERRYDNT
jgi:hypothetical protein